MSLRTSLHEWLRDTLDVPVSEGALPLRPTLPRAVQRFITATSTLTQSQPVSLLQRRVQVDIITNNDSEADELVLKLIRAVDGYHGRMGDVDIGWAGILTELEALPEDVKGAPRQYRRIVDIGLAYQEVRP
jgi:hypothetical protein